MKSSFNFKLSGIQGQLTARMKNHDKIVFIDTETGGLHPAHHSLLSIGLVEWQNGRISQTKEILVDDGELKATEAALAINKIDLNSHRESAISPNEAIQGILSFIGWTSNQHDKVTLAGHNVGFDIKFTHHLFESQNYNFEDYFSHRSIDTSSILHYLYFSGKLSLKIIGSSEAFEHFGIKVHGRHTALGDAIATAKLFNELIKLV
jgi:DNA polymerase-3 subunit epsilon